MNRDNDVVWEEDDEPRNTDRLDPKILRTFDVTAGRLTDGDKRMFLTVLRGSVPLDPAVRREIADELETAWFGPGRRPPHNKISQSKLGLWRAFAERCVAQEMSAQAERGERVARTRAMTSVANEAGLGFDALRDRLRGK